MESPYYLQDTISLLFTWMFNEMKLLCGFPRKFGLINSLRNDTKLKFLRTAQYLENLFDCLTFLNGGKLCSVLEKR